MLKKVNRLTARELEELLLSWGEEFHVEKTILYESIRYVKLQKGRFTLKGEVNYSDGAIKFVPAFGGGTGLSLEEAYERLVRACSNHCIKLITS